MHLVNLRINFMLFASLAAIGCGGAGPDHAKCAPVSGTVTYKGQLVEGATVSFWAPKAPRAATGQTDAKGSFRLTTFATDDGAVLGTHAVTVTKAAPAAAMNASDMATGKAAAAAVKDPLPAKYADAKTTTLKFEVKSGSNTAPLELID
ncbi:MAG: hypothetical protein NTZ32_18835 [Planctomycetales bacterium]|nr:hypothetical protein [Planctomycetales bacterium]